MERGEATATTSGAVEQPDHRRHTAGKNRKANRETLRAMMKLAFTREELKQITKKEGNSYKMGTDYNDYKQEIEEARHEHLRIWQSRRGHGPQTGKIQEHLGGQTAERAVPETRQRGQHQARPEWGQ
ncbi:unnamed protein product [Hermetia illucens]|uniref:Uncharacterized protein n=1 Tax=Hermetia illucens TaxID=343691 RepID=A0A7R8UFI6_HERIL|nr:unnamed protein product [Hermetia illucens]